MAPLHKMSGSCDTEAVLLRMRDMDCRDAVVGSMSYIGGRLTAPVSGDEGKDREIADKAKHNVNRGADKLSNAGEDVKDTVCSLAS